MKPHKIQTLSTFLIACAVIFAIYFTYYHLSWLIPLCFTDPQRWLGALNTEGAAVSTLNRWALFLAWFIVLLAANYAIYRGIRVLNQLRLGWYFTPKTSSHLFHFGCAICLSMISDTLIAIVHAPIMSHPLGDAAAKFRFRIDFGDISLALCGLGFCLVAWALMVAHQIQEENESIV